MCGLVWLTDISDSDIFLVMTNRDNKTRFLVLLALSGGEKHGYEVSKYIEEQTNGFFSLPFGSLYPVLHKLEKDKLVRASWKDKSSKKPKKAYALTAQGQRALVEEVDNFRSSTSAIRRLIPQGV